jgi:hypothetical protein
MPAEVTSDSDDLDTASEPTVFTFRQQLRFLKAFQRSASPLAACLSLNLLLESFDLTRDQDENFRGRVNRLLEAFNENVDAAIYRDAVAGNASSQANHLRLRANSCDVDTDLADRAQELAEMPTEELLAYQARLRNLGGSET